MADLVAGERKGVVRREEEDPLPMANPAWRNVGAPYPGREPVSSAPYYPGAQPRTVDLPLVRESSGNPYGRGGITPIADRRERLSKGPSGDPREETAPATPPAPPPPPAPPGFPPTMGGPEAGKSTTRFCLQSPRAFDVRCSKAWEYVPHGRGDGGTEGARYAQGAGPGSPNRGLSLLDLYDPDGPGDAGFGTGKNQGTSAGGGIQTKGLKVNIPRILVVGCGGGGSNMVDRLEELGLDGARTLSINTDRLHLESVAAQKKVLVGKRLSGGTGTGGDASMGRRCAESCLTLLEPMLAESDLAILLTTLGGGTGTGATPVVAKMAREAGATSVVLATIPFGMESTRRQKAMESLPGLRRSADNVLLFDKERLSQVAPQMKVEEALGFMNDLMAEIVLALVEALTRSSRINIDLADLRGVLTLEGLSVVYIGEDDGAAPIDLVNATLDNPFADIDHRGAGGALVHITGGPGLTLQTAKRTADLLTLSLDETANVILGARVDETMGDRVKVVALFTGIPPREGEDDGGEGAGGRAPGEGDPVFGVREDTPDIFTRYGVYVVGDEPGPGGVGTGPGMSAGRKGARAEKGGGAVSGGAVRVHAREDGGRGSGASPRKSKVGDRTYFQVEDHFDGEGRWKDDGKKEMIRKLRVLKRRGADGGTKEGGPGKGTETRKEGKRDEGTVKVRPKDFIIEENGKGNAGKGSAGGLPDDIMIR